MIKAVNSGLLSNSSLLSGAFSGENFFLHEQYIFLVLYSQHGI